MKKLLLLLTLCFFTFSSFGQHDVFFNFSDFLLKTNTVGYRYHLTENTSLGGDVSFSNSTSNIVSSSSLKDASRFQLSSEYLVYFNPKQGCDRFYVGPNLAFRTQDLDYEYLLWDPLASETIRYSTNEKNLLLSLTIGGTWRHHSGFFFNANGTLGRSIFDDSSTTSSDISFNPTKQQVVLRAALNIGWQFGKKELTE